MTQILSPSGIATLLMLGGLLALAWRRTRGISLTLLASGAVITLVFSSGGIAHLLMAPLEPRGATSPAPPGEVTGHIVVLTGWASDDPSLAPSSRLNTSSAYRVLRALETWRAQPDSRVVVSGDAATAATMGAVLRALGVPPDKLEVDAHAHNTAASAANLRTLLGDAPFKLVTSAGHMRRARGAFEKAGMRPLPVPTDYKSARDTGGADWFPDPDSLAVSDLAIHEYLGFAWYDMTGRL